MSLRTVIFTAALMGAATMQAAQAQGKLNMICCSPQPVCDAVVREFSNETGIDVSMIRMSAGETYARIRADARNPKVDIWFSGTHEPHYQAASENLTQSYKSSRLDNLVPLAQKMAEDTDYKGNAFAVGVMGFGVNTQMLEAKGLPKPTSWADLLREEYRGEIVLANPNTAGTGYTVLTTLVEMMGEDAAFDYLKALNNNVSSYTKSGTAVSAQAARGEVAIAVAFLHDITTMIRQGFPLEAVAPSDGVGHTLDGLSIVAGARNLEQAKAFVDWILTPKAQSINIDNGLNSYPTAKGTKFSDYTVNIEGMNLIDMNHKLQGSPEMRRALLARWDREIGAIAGQ